MAMTAPETRDAERTKGTLDEASSLLPEVGEIDDEIRGWARERPLLTLGMAILAGYVAGRMLSRV